MNYVKFIWSLLFYLLIITSINAQNSKDLQLLKKKLSIEKNINGQGNLMLQIGEIYLTEFPDSSAHYASNAEALFRKNNSKIGIANSHLLAAKALNKSSEYPESLGFSKRANAAYKKLDKKSKLADIFFEQGFSYYYLRKNDSSIISMQKAIELYGSSVLHLNLAEAYRIIALSHWSRANYGEGLVNINNSIKTYEQLDDSVKYSRALNTKGAILWGLTDYENSLKMYFKALSIEEALDNKKGQQIVLYNNIGMVYFDWGRHAEAYNYFKQAEKLVPNSKHKVGIAYTFLNLGTYYSVNDSIELALSFLEKSEILYSALNDINGVCLCIIRKGQCYTKKRDFESAKSTFNEAIKFSRESKNRHREATAYFHMALNEIKQNSFKAALNYSLTGYNTSTNGKFKDLLYLYCEQLSKIYENIGNTRLSLEFLQKALVLKDEIFKEKTAVQFGIMELIHENEQRQFENSQLQDQNILKEKTILFISIIIVLTLALLVAILISNFFLSKKKKELQKVIQTKDKIFSIVSHDLRGPVGNLNNMVDMMVTNDLEERDYRKLIKLSKPVITSTYNMLENLLVWARANLGKLEFKGKDLNLNSTITETIIPINSIAQKKSITIHFDAKKEIMIFSDLVLFQTILRNLINNAIKFTHELGTIYVFYKINNDKIIISVADNGIGISHQNQEKLFTGTNNTLGTNNEKGSGLGLMLCKDLAIRNGGNLWLESNEGKGSTFSFSVSLSTNS